ncbi:sperm axonemal maintenance protein CFAP97D1 [Hoplias malabaricus]|uniref:sperm axonemal maintenance protein CFAP97D1 n=1 Tax=Hoplias malabaricus TaxID=27720 RepID=UPI0034626C24
MQHQAYQPLQPCVNKYLQEKWDKSCYEMHRKRVQSAKSTLNTTPPLVYGHLLTKKKKQKLEEERLSTIQRENNMLLDKISHIMKTTGRIDCRNDYVKKSLYADKREKDLLQIVKENQLIIQRLSQCAPQYSVKLWREQWLENLHLMEQIGRFPHLHSSQVSSGVSSQKHKAMSKEKASKKSTTSLHEDSLSREEAALECEKGEQNKQRDTEDKSPESEDEPSQIKC